MTQGVLFNNQNMGEKDNNPRDYKIIWTRTVTENEQHDTAEYAEILGAEFLGGSVVRMTPNSAQELWNNYSDRMELVRA